MNYSQWREARLKHHYYCEKTCLQIDLAEILGDEDFVCFLEQVVAGELYNN